MATHDRAINAGACGSSGFVTLMGSLGVNLPRLIIERHVGIAELGVFAALSYFVQIARTVISALGIAVAPRLSTFRADGNVHLFFSTLFRLLAVCGAVSIFAAIGTMAVGATLITLLYDADVASHKVLLIVLIVGAGFEFSGSIMSFGLTAARRIKIQAPIELMSMVIGSDLLSMADSVRWTCWSRCRGSRGKRRARDRDERCTREPVAKMVQQIRTTTKLGFISNLNWRKLRLRIRNAEG